MAIQPLSAVIITLNVGHALEACLQSLDFVDEIVIVDSGSTDATLEVAACYGARVVQQSFLGFGPQKQFAVGQARNDWVLCIDADERVSEALKVSICDSMTSPRYSAYKMPRCNRFMGHWLKHGEGYPDWSLRLFDRRQAGWSDDQVHEYVIAEGDVGRLGGDLLHESEDGLANYLAKQDRYTSLQAERLKTRRRGSLVSKLIFSPPVRFVKFYFIRRGFLDGVPGLVHICIGCFNSFIKYAKALEMKKKN